MAGSKTLDVTRVIGKNCVGAKRANSFFWSAVGADVQLEVGFIDLKELADAVRAIDEGKPQPVLSSEVSDRFSIAPENVIILARLALEAAIHLRDNGHLANIDFTDLTNVIKKW